MHGARVQGTDGPQYGGIALSWQKLLCAGVVGDHGFAVDPGGVECDGDGDARAILADGAVHEHGLRAQDATHHRDDAVGGIVDDRGVQGVEAHVVGEERRDGAEEERLVLHVDGEIVQSARSVGHLGVIAQIDDAPDAELTERADTGVVDGDEVARPVQHPLARASVAGGQTADVAEVRRTRDQRRRHASCS